VTATIDELADRLSQRSLPGGRVTIEPHEAAIADVALRAVVDPQTAHPVWFVIASLRGMGITVDELCVLAEQKDHDALLFGSCEIRQIAPLRVGATYTTTAAIEGVTSRTTRDGYRLDSLQVRVVLTEATPDSPRQGKTAEPTGTPVGEVVSVYLFKRGDPR